MRTVQLADFISLRRGASYKGAAVGEKGVPLLGLGTIAKHGGFKASGVRRYDGEAPERMLVRGGDLYVSLKDMTQEAALLGAVARVPSGIAVGRLTQDTIALDFDSEFGADRDFVYWVLRGPSFRTYCRNLGTGTTNLDLSQNDFLSFEVVLPVLEEQKAIVRVLGSLDEKIAVNHEAAFKARELVVALVSAAGSSVKVGEVARMVRKSVDPSSLDVESVTHFSLPAFDSGAAIVETPQDIKSAKNLIQESVVLVSKLNPRIPRIWAVDRLPAGPALASTEFVALAPREMGIGSLWAMLLQPRFTHSLLERTAGTTGSHQRVKPEQMLDVDVPDVRELAAEKKDLIESLCRKFNEVADENERLAATRDELLPLLMSGKITVKDAEKTVEEVV